MSLNKHNFNLVFDFWGQELTFALEVDLFEKSLSVKYARLILIF